MCDIPSELQLPQCMIRARTEFCGVIATYLRRHIDPPSRGKVWGGGGTQAETKLEPLPLYTAFFVICVFFAGTFENVPASGILSCRHRVPPFDPFRVTSR